MSLTSGLLPFLAAFALVSGSLLPVADAAPLDPPVEHTVVSRAILHDPLDISLTGPSDLEVAQLTIEPGGTTGARTYGGPTLVSVTDGTASRSVVEAGSCTSRFVFQPGASSGWHSHPGGMLVSIDEGHFHWVLVEEGRCTRKEGPAGTGYWERAGPGEEAHDFANDGAGPATFHYVGLSSLRGPLVRPQAPGPECSALARG